MTIQEFELYQEQTFDSFCKETIHNEGVDAHRELENRAKREVQLSTFLPDSFTTEDTYHPYRKVYPVLNFRITVRDRELGETLQFIIPQYRNILLLYYFLEYNDMEISRMLGISNDAVRIRRKAALRQLHTLLEDNPYVQ